MTLDEFIEENEVAKLLDELFPSCNVSQAFVLCALIEKAYNEGYDEGRYGWKDH